MQRHPKYPDPATWDYINCVNEAYATMYLSGVWYRILLTDIGEIDEVHLEMVDSQKRWTPSFLLTAYINLTDEIFSLTKFGVQVTRPISLVIPIGTLLTEDLVTLDADRQIDTLLLHAGDRFEISGVWYDVTEVNPRVEKVFGPTDIPIFVEIAGTRMHEDSADYISPPTMHKA